MNGSREPRGPPWRSVGQGVVSSFHDMEIEGQGASDLPRVLVPQLAKRISRSMNGGYIRPAAQCRKLQKEPLLPVENRVECSRLSPPGSSLDMGQLNGQRPFSCHVAPQPFFHCLLWPFVPLIPVQARAIMWFSGPQSPGTRPPKS